jgi:hypothetical protein
MPSFACPQEFKASDDVSLIIHTVTYPELLYRQDLILLELQAYLTSLNITNTLFMGDSKLPHIYVTGALQLTLTGPDMGLGTGRSPLGKASMVEDGLAC